MPGLLAAGSDVGGLYHGAYAGGLAAALIFGLTAARTALAPDSTGTVEAFQSLNMLPVPWNEARDVSESVLWLASDQAHHVTGIVLPIDAGQLAK